MQKVPNSSICQRGSSTPKLESTRHEPNLPILRTRRKRSQRNFNKQFMPSPRDSTASNGAMEAHVGTKVNSAAIVAATVAETETAMANADAAENRNYRIILIDIASDTELVDTVQKNADLPRKKLVELVI